MISQDIISAKVPYIQASVLTVCYSPWKGGRCDDVLKHHKKTGAAQPRSQRIHHNESVSGPSLVELWALPWETRAIRRSVDFPE